MSNFSFCHNVFNCFINYSFIYRVSILLTRWFFSKQSAADLLYVGKGLNNDRKIGYWYFFHNVFCLNACRRNGSQRTFLSFATTCSTLFNNESFFFIEFPEKYLESSLLQNCFMRYKGLNYGIFHNISPIST